MKNIIYATLTVIFLATLVSYIFDCFYNFNNAITQPEFMLAYLIDYLISNSWFILLCVIVYAVVFKNIAESYGIYFKILFVILVSYLYALAFHMDGFTLARGAMKEIKLVVVFSLTGILTIFINDRYFPKSDEKRSPA